MARIVSRALIRFAPPGVALVARHRLANFRCPRTEIFFVNNSILIYDERHDSRGAVFCGISDKRKSVRHLATFGKASGAKRSVRSLCFQNAEIVTLKRLRSFASISRGVF